MSNGNYAMRDGSEKMARMFSDLTRDLENALVVAYRASSDGYPQELDDLMAAHEEITDAHLDVISQELYLAEMEARDRVREHMDSVHGNGSPCEDGCWASPLATEEGR